jgi:hypothetical protein
VITLDPLEAEGCLSPDDNSGELYYRLEPKS